MATLLDQLREQRAAARTAADQILTRAAEESRDLAADELTAYQGHVVEQRDADDAIEQEHERLLAEARAAARAGRGPTLTRADAELARQFRSAIYAKNPQPIEVYAEDLADDWPADVPEPVQGRSGRVRIHTRDTLKSTATQAMNVDAYSRIVQHMAYSSPEMRSTDLLTFTVRPWLLRIERAISTLLPRAQTAKFNAGGFVRATLLDRYTAHKLGIEAGFLTVNEARELEDRPPLPDGGIA